MKNSGLTFGILGAGAVGGYLGARLAHYGHRVVLVGRPDFVREARVRGLTFSALDGQRHHVDGGRIKVSESSADLCDCNIVLVTVKSADSLAAVSSLPDSVRSKTRIVSMQNGVRNVEAIRSRCADVTAAMVPFNVVRRDPVTFHQATSGRMLFGAGATGELLSGVFSACGLPAGTHRDIDGVLWGKLLFNLNNALNALTGRPIREGLATLAYRRLLAALIREGLHVLRIAGIRSAPPMGVPPGLAVHVMGLPDWLFMRVARAMLAIDPEARSSMWQDLDRGRRTEVDYLNGEIVSLAAKCGVAAPLNARITELVHQAEAGGFRSLSVAELTAQLGS